jgi:thioester reductase-like protein
MDGATIIEYLRGKSILITGSTGFLGKSMCLPICMLVSSRLDYICYCKGEFTNKYISWMYLSVDQSILPCVNNIKELMNGLCVCDCVSMHAVLVEKILRVQPHVHKMYLLVRAIDAPSANHRVQQEVPQFLLLMIIPITRRT